MGSTGIAMSELDMEIGEYLPAREVMTGCCSRRSSSHQSNTAVIGNGNGNTEQNGLINVSLLNGNLNGNFNSVSQSN